MSKLCPLCHKHAELGQASFPFCSARCKLLDLNSWASGSYVIPGRELYSLTELEDEVLQEPQEKGQMEDEMAELNSHHEETKPTLVRKGRKKVH